MTDPNYIEDFWIEPKTAFDERSNDRMSAFTVSGPGIGVLTFDSRADAEAKGRQLARSKKAALWYRETVFALDELIETFRSNA
jgi:hypothetical protein